SPDSPIRSPRAGTTAATGQSRFGAGRSPTPSPDGTPTSTTSANSGGMCAPDDRGQTSSRTGLAVLATFPPLRGGTSIFVRERYATSAAIAIAPPTATVPRPSPTPPRCGGSPSQSANDAPSGLVTM